MPKRSLKRRRSKRVRNSRRYLKKGGRFTHTECSDEIVASYNRDNKKNLTKGQYCVEVTGQQYRFCGPDVTSDTDGLTYFCHS